MAKARAVEVRDDEGRQEVPCGKEAQDRAVRSDGRRWTGQGLEPTRCVVHLTDGSTGDEWQSTGYADTEL